MKTDHSQNAIQVEAERTAFAEHFNSVLKEAPYVEHKLPITPDNLIDSVRDGLVLSGVINYMKPGTIDAKSLVKIDDVDDKDPNAEKKRIFNVTANVNIVMEGCKTIGLRLVNIGSNDIIEGNENMILAFIWQLIRHHVLTSVNLKAHPQLIRLLNPGEGIDVLLSMNPEKILLRWFNYHLGRDPADVQVGNFGADVSDGRAFLVLMRQIAPKKCNLETIAAVLDEDDSDKRITTLLETADEMKCRCFASSKTIVGKAQKLNLAFTATLFNSFIGINLPSEDEIREMLARIDELEEKVQKLNELLDLAAKDQEMAVKLREQDLMAEVEQSKAKLAEMQAKFALFKKNTELVNEDLVSTIISNLDLENNETSQGKELVDELEGKDAAEKLSASVNWLLKAYLAEKQHSRDLINSLQKTKDINDLISTKIVEVSEELIKYRNPPANVLKKRSSKGCL